jgi:hypothetical protein
MSFTKSTRGRLSGMPTPNSRTAYKQYYDLLDRALDSPTGIRFPVADYGEGRQFQVMLNKARANDRELNGLRDHNDPLCGVSDFDVLVTTLRQEEDGSGWFIYIKRRVIGEIEELPA